MPGSRFDDHAEGRVEDALAQLKLINARDQAGTDLEARILARVGETPQRHGWRHLPGLWPGDSPSRSPHARVAGLAAIGLAGGLLVALVGVALLVPGNPSEPAGSGPASTAVSTDVAAHNPPHVGGTCPLTPVTRLVGGSAPEVDVGGLRWRWGFVPWVVGTSEKVVWLTDSGTEPEAGVSIYAVRLDLPILIDGSPVAFAGAASRAVYAAALDAGWVTKLQLPAPGCWLLTAIWSAGASSIVVAAAPASGTASPEPSTTASPVPGTTLATCPATPRSVVPPPQGWPGPAYVDGPFRWLLPVSETWRLGGDGDKLVLDSQIGWDIGDMRIVAIPLVRAGAVGWLGANAVAGDIPPGFGGGTLGVGVTLPAGGCWAFAFMDSRATSTIVDSVGR